MMKHSALTMCWLAATFAASGLTAADAEVPQTVAGFLQTNCLDCHQGDAAEAGLDLDALSGDLADESEADVWVRVIDRVHHREMPPAEYGELPEEDLVPFVTAASDWLRQEQQQQFAATGRVKARRLTKLQLERSLHDLLGIDIPLATLLPDEPKTDGFSTVAKGQSLSHFQLQNHLQVVDTALDEAFRRATSEPDEWQKSLSARDLARENPRRRCREPEMIDDLAVIWSSRLTFYGRLPSTTARRDGWYRLTLKASALNKPQDHGVWCTVRTGMGVSSAPLLAWAGAFEATDEPQEWTFEAWLPDGHMFEVRPGDGTLKMGRFQGGQVGAGEGGPQNLPGVAFHSAVLERIHRGPDNDTIRDWLFGDLQLKQDRKNGPQLISEDPAADAAALMRRFAQRAFRRPVSDDVVEPYIDLVRQSLQDGQPLLAALRGGYRALLCSPRFLYFYEEPGALDDFALASRLSYFLWNRPPDQTLLELADAGTLSSPAALRQQVDRMLDSDHGREFVRDFAAEWLDLNQIDFTEPDRKLYPDFDVIVQQSMLDETHTYLQTLLDQNLSVARLIDSDFTFLNSRLARYYDIGNVSGDKLQQVSLDPADRRGGVLTQGSILKVTANGTTTSPVLRGVWVSERLLGQEIPPPPKNVPAVEPDIRGTSTIREMLAKHKSDDSCASCHVKIDPPGFALENFDPAGQWRTHYPGSRGRGKGPEVDPGYEMPNGQRFTDLQGFQKVLLTDVEPIASNVAQKLLTYGTGAKVAFADRDIVQEIVARTESEDYGFRSLVHEVVASSVFQNK